MPQISFDGAAAVLTAANDEHRDVRYSVEDCRRPLVMSRKPFADPAIQVVGLADVAHVQLAWSRLLTEGVNARERLEKLAKLVHREGVARA